MKYDFDGIAESVSRRTGTPERDVVRTLVWWTRHAPPDYREDAAQDIALALLESPTADARLAWAIAKRTVQDLWKRWHTRQHYGGASLDALLDDDTGRTLADTVADVVDYEAQVCGAIECSRIWGLLPDWVQEVVQKRLTGHGVNGLQAQTVKAWALRNVPELLAS